MTDQLLITQLSYLLKLLHELGAEEYNKKSAMLGNVSVGQHVRHIVELIQCMVQGYATGTVNYDARKRDVRIETDALFAIAQIKELIDSMSFTDKGLLLMTENEQIPAIKTFYNREVLYNTEHAIHHMALIRVALREMDLEIVDEYFGVAPATIQFRKSA